MLIKTKCPQCDETDTLEYDGGDSGTYFDPATPPDLRCYSCDWRTQDENEIAQYIPSKEKDE